MAMINDFKYNLTDYYAVIRKSIGNLDNIVAKIVLQGPTVLLAVITASLLAYRENQFGFSILLNIILR